MALLIFNGVSLRVITMGSTFMFIHGVISSTALDCCNSSMCGWLSSFLGPAKSGAVVFWPDLFSPKRRIETTDSNYVLTVVHTKGGLLDTATRGPRNSDVECLLFEFATDWLGPTVATGIGRLSATLGRGLLGVCHVRYSIAWAKPVILNFAARSCSACYTLRTQKSL
jgi:hypothetical protein